jgi:hypothetical protein
MRKLSREVKSPTQVTSQEVGKSPWTRPLKGLPAPESPSFWSPAAGAQPCGQGCPLLTHLQGCDLEQLQTQPWVWPPALWPDCKVQSEQDLLRELSFKGMKTELNGRMKAKTRSPCSLSSVLATTLNPSSGQAHRLFCVSPRDIEDTGIVQCPLSLTFNLSIFPNFL